MSHAPSDTGLWAVVVLTRRAGRAASVTVCDSRREAEKLAEKLAPEAAAHGRDVQVVPAKKLAEASEAA